MNSIKTYLINFSFAVIFGLCIVFRATWYGDLRLAVATIDTASYINSANNTSFTWEIFSGGRLFTTNLLYQFSISEECPNPNFSNPFMGNEIEREVMACFKNIALLQNILSILGWGTLAYVLSRHLVSPFYKLLSVITILSFGFTPQIAEWDSVLGGESLSVSLCALSIGLFIQVVHKVAKNQEKTWSISSMIATASWLVVFLMWCFVRDVQTYALFVTLILLLPLLFVREIRSNKLTIPTISLLIIAFIVGAITSHTSMRWQPNIKHAMQYHIFPYPARVEFMMSRGMPDINLTKEYNAWFNKKANKEYGIFLISHPGFVITSLMDLSFYLRSDFLQTYFPASEIKNRETLLTIGEILHPESNYIYLLAFILLTTLIHIVFNTKNKNAIAWAWLALWMFLYASASLVLSLLGDVDGTRRHIYPSVELFRLFNWVFLFIILDLQNSKIAEK